MLYQLNTIKQLIVRFIFIDHFAFKLYPINNLDVVDMFLTYSNSFPMLCYYYSTSVMKISIIDKLRLKIKHYNYNTDVR